jgi:hypothetical protein
VNKTLAVGNPVAAGAVLAALSRAEVGIANRP